MNINEVRKLLDLFADFANSSKAEDVAKCFRKVVRASHNLNLIAYMNTGGGVETPLRNIKDIPFIKVIKCRELVIEKIDEYIQGIVLINIGSFVELHIHRGEKPEIIFSDHGNRSIGSDSINGLVSVMAIAMFIAQIKGIQHCLSCGKYFFRHTGHKKLTCSYTCRARRSRNLLKRKVDL